MTPVTEPAGDPVQLFLDAAAVVRDAIASGAVRAAWDEPSVLEAQLVGGLAGHLARGAVTGGAVVMPLGPYLDTRLVEQVVHLDDLARSIGAEPFPVAPAARQRVLHIGTDIGILRRGATAMVRRLYRSKLEPVLPVI